MECRRRSNDKHASAGGQQLMFDRSTATNLWPFEDQEPHLNNPIYSEIDDDSILISESPNLDNRTGVRHFFVDNNPELIYARVNKFNKRVSSTKPIREILRNSTASEPENVKRPVLASLPEPSETEIDTFLSESSMPRATLLCQSLCNMRIVDKPSLEAQQNLSKSDLSLHRSEIFLENLRKNELLPNLHQYASSRQQAILNAHPNNSLKSCEFRTETNNDNEVLNKKINEIDESYYKPNESLYFDSTLDGTYSHISAIDSPSHNNQSTPKKPLFTTKDGYEQAQTNLDSMHGKRVGLIADRQICEEFRNSYDEISYNQSSKGGTHSNGVEKELKLCNTLPLLKHMTVVLRKSFRKGKQLIKMESNSLSASLHISNADSRTGGKKETDRSGIYGIFGSSYDIASLFTLNHSISVDEQLNKVVNICRNIPDLENSTEMVEAERLLLFSKLRKEILANETNTQLRNIHQIPTMRVFVDDMFLPLLSDGNKDLYFNYFYIVTFECGGIIRSTQSKECQNDELVFRECGIEFAVWSKHKTINDEQNIVRGNIFMLRLRKVSTLSLEPKHKKNSERQRRTSLTSETSSSTDVIDSRFRFQASFALDPTCFIPYEYVQQESNNSAYICIRSSKICSISLMNHTKSSNLSSHIKLKVRAEIRLQKRTHSGFLNVEDPFVQHNWNRRWCTLNGFLFSVWNEVNNLNEVPLFYFDLHNGQHQLQYPAPRNMCARPRSFCLHGSICISNGEMSKSAIYFSAETQHNLDEWLENINFAFNLSKCWLNQL